MYARSANTGELPSVSVVIPTYGRRRRLPEVLCPLLADPATHELIVVVDGCHDGSIELLDDLAATDARVMPVFVENAGAMAARCTGVERASGEVILILDDDVVAEAGLVAGHAGRHAEKQRLVVMGYMPVAEPAHDDLARFIGELYSREYERTCLDHEADPRGILYRLWGGNVSLRRRDFLAVGLDARRSVPGYNADRDFGLRCLRAGLDGVFDRSLRARHLYERTLDGYLRDARDSGESTLRVHAAHGDVVGPYRPSFEGGLPFAGRLAIQASRRRAARAILLPALRGVIGVGRSIRSSYLQRNALVLLGRIEQRRGAVEAVRRRRSAPSSLVTAAATQ